MDKNSLIAYKIKEIRKSSGFSAEYVANQLGISKGAYSNLENGKVEVTINKIYMLADILNKSIFDFIFEPSKVNQINYGSNCQNINCNNFYNRVHDEVNKLHNESIESIKKANDLLRRNEE